MSILTNLMGTNPAVYGWILKGKTRELRPNIAGQGVEINGTVCGKKECLHTHICRLRLGLCHSWAKKVFEEIKQYAISVR